MPGPLPNITEWPQTFTVTVKGCAPQLPDSRHSGVFQWDAEKGKKPVLVNGDPPNPGPKGLPSRDGVPPPKTRGQRRGGLDGVISGGDGAQSVNGDPGAAPRGQKVGWGEYVMRDDCTGYMDDLVLATKSDFPRFMPGVINKTRDKFQHRWKGHVIFAELHCDGAGELSSAKLEEALKSQVKGPKPRRRSNAGQVSCQNGGCSQRR
eukprot:COSAG01_NODE_199_length_22202_cov_23.993668_22_plen_206_part_00